MMSKLPYLLHEPLVVDPGGVGGVVVGVLRGLTDESWD